MGLDSAPGVSVTEVNVRRIGAGIYVVELVGDHGLHNASEIAATLRTALLGETVVVDLSRASFVDSSAIREILVAGGHANRNGRRLRIQVEPGGHVEKTLQRMLVDVVATLYHSRREALAAP